MKKILLGILTTALIIFGLIKINAAVNTDIYLSILGGNVTIWATWSFDFGSMVISDVDSPLAKQFTGWDYFWVRDLKGINSGYYTTIQTTDLTGTNGTISGSYVAMKVDSTATTKINGTTNANVLVNSGLLSYTAIDTPITFVYRNNAENAGKIGEYAVYPWLQVTVPAYQAVGSYHGTLTYTLYEN